MKKLKFINFRELSIFFWLILITIIAVFTISIYSENKVEQSNQIKASLDNIYLKKIIREVTNN